MERVKRFELSTSSLARKRSSQLSYTRKRPVQEERELQAFQRIVNGLARFARRAKIKIIAGIPPIIWAG